MQTEIKCEYGHYAAYIDGEFFCSADTYGEAEREIESMMEV